MPDSNEESRLDLIPEGDKSAGKKVWLTPNGAIDRNPTPKVETDLDRIRKKDVIDVWSRDTGNNGPFG